MGRRFGKYIIDRKIAVGGMAEIFRAHTSAGQDVAIKLILPNYASQPKFVQMFLDEARIVIRLKHPNIVQLLDFGKVSETYFYSMEWVDGKSLSDIVRRQLDAHLLFPVDVALMIVFDMCQALDHAHARTDQYDRPLDIVHRDISPPNILITREAETKVTDFGIAYVRNKGLQTRPGVIRGKFSYMSPEQSYGKDIDRRSDIFSVGIVLHEILTGQRLFLREQEVKTIEAVRECRVPSARRTRRDLSEGVERILKKALARERRKRYRTAGEMAEEVRKVLGKDFPYSTRRTVAEFMQLLFPEEKFSGAETPIEVLCERWRAEVQPSYEKIAPGDSSDWLLDHPVIVSLGLGLFCLAVAEVYIRFFAK